jgi:N-acetylmuramoyl-L-alanine amidase
LAPEARQALDEISQQSANKHTQSNKEAGKDPALRERRFSETAADEANHAQHRGDEKASAESKSGNIARVSGILHWSTPDYTRVAIELDQKVEFDAQRIDHPNRIFFDLQSTQLAPALADRSFEVDDGILRRVRVAQFQADRTRVVLDVEDLSDYNSFVLSHPWRLIIDVRSKQSTSATNKEKNRLPTFPRVVGRGDAMPHAQNDLELAPQYPSKAVENRTPSKPGAVASGASKQFPAEDGQGRKSAQLPPPASQTGPVKKIVEADNDDEPDVSVTSLQPADLRPEITSAQKQSIVSRARPDQTTGDRNASEDSPQAGRSRRNSTALGADSDVHEAKPTSKGDRSLIRALGLKIGRIVIDPGHGGHDTGTIGPNGLEEKDLVLGVATRLGKLLQSRLGSEVIYTRQDDTFIPLETRTAIANQEQADLFVSIHANSSRDPDARGVETYYLNFTSSPDALEVAARENAVSDKSIHELQDLVRKIALKEKIEESREFASDVQHALHAGLASKSPGIRDRGVRKAPFIVLIGANMPSILAEISFISNPTDERKLETTEYRQRIAESLYRGIAKYVAGLSGVKVASRMASANNH